MTKDERKIILDVESKQGQTIQTVWGPSLVVGIVRGDGNKLFVHMKEFGEEDYHIALPQWFESIR